MTHNNIIMPRAVSVSEAGKLVLASDILPPVTHASICVIRAIRVYLNRIKKRITVDKFR